MEIREKCILVYAGAGTDLAPVILGTGGDYESQGFYDACRSLYNPEYSILISTLQKVDRFAYLDINPYVEFPELNGRRLAKGIYPSIDHFVTFWEVYLRLKLCVSTFTDHRDESYFEVELDDGKFFEYHYCSDFFNIDQMSRIFQMMEQADVVYQQGWMPEGDEAWVYYSAFPNASVFMIQESLRNKLELDRFKSNSNRKEIGFLFHPSYKICMYTSGKCD